MVQQEQQRRGRQSWSTDVLCEGLDHVLGLFEDCSETPLGRHCFPRTISTAATNGRQYLVESRDEVLTYFKASLREDCRINAYADYDILKRMGQLPQDYNPPPRHLFIDIDRTSFETDEELEQALKETVSNIKKHIFMSSSPAIIIQSGNGYHIHVLLKLDTAFENMSDFEMFDNPSVKFMRWAEYKLSNGKADQHHNPSFKSCMFRVPGTLNSKCKAVGRDPLVRIVEPWYEIDKKFSRGTPRQEFLNDFHAYLVQELIDDKVERTLRVQRSAFDCDNNNDNNNNSNSKISPKKSIAWIEKILQTGIEDGRKNMIFWVLAPYLITIKGLGYDRAYSTLINWLDTCSKRRRFKPNWMHFQYRIRYCLEIAEQQNRMPIKFETFKQYYPDIYKQLF